MAHIIRRGHSHHDADREIHHRALNGALREFLVDPALDHGADLRLQIGQSGTVKRVGAWIHVLFNTNATPAACARERIAWSISCSLAPVTPPWLTVSCRAAMPDFRACVP